MGTGARGSTGSSLPSHCSSSSACPPYPSPSAGSHRATSPPYPSPSAGPHRATSPPYPRTWTSRSVMTSTPSLYGYKRLGGLVVTTLRFEELGHARGIDLFAYGSHYFGMDLGEASLFFGAILSTVGMMTFLLFSLHIIEEDDGVDADEGRNDCLLEIALTAIYAPAKGSDMQLF